MRLVKVHPNMNYRSLDEWSYECACGKKITHLVARDSGHRH